MNNLLNFNPPEIEIIIIDTTDIITASGEDGKDYEGELIK